jgi:DNA-3-methyladenine glycosylase II
VHVLPVEPPYRLDLTAAVLRRFSTNAVDAIVAGGIYRRAMLTPRGPVVVEVRQTRSDAVRLVVSGAPAARRGTPKIVRRMLGLDADVSAFERRARSVAWLAPIARRMLGVRPPRYPTLWEACANAVVFQQISLHAASAIMHRLVDALGTVVAHGAATLRAFPEPASVARASGEALRAAGLSAGKVAALREIGATLDAGGLTEAGLERLSSPGAAEALTRLRGIGPWTAAIVLLRGLGRLDVFPENDSGAARSLAFLGGGKPVATAPVLELLGDQRGMLYYHLLLARLEARGDLAPPA